MVRADLIAEESKCQDPLTSEVLECAKDQRLKCTEKDVEEEEMRDARDAEEAFFMLVN